jgi:predicted peptidase
VLNGSVAWQGEIHDHDVSVRSEVAKWRDVIGETLELPQKWIDVGLSRSVGGVLTVVQVNKPDLQAKAAEVAGQRDRRRRLADAAFWISERQDFHGY